jgi:hypothetical protein
LTSSPTPPRSNALNVHIDIKFTWWEFLLASQVIGWPALILGGALGALAWRGRRIFGGAAGAIVGNIAWAVSVLYLK